MVSWIVIKTFFISCTQRKNRSGARRWHQSEWNSKIFTYCCLRRCIASPDGTEIMLANSTSCCYVLRDSEFSPSLVLPDHDLKVASVRICSLRHLYMQRGSTAAPAISPTSTSWRPPSSSTKWQDLHNKNATLIHKHSFVSTESTISPSQMECVSTLQHKKESLLWSEQYTSSLEIV